MTHPMKHDADKSAHEKMRALGGRLTAGAITGEGRLQKEKIQKGLKSRPTYGDGAPPKLKATNRKRGGRVEHRAKHREKGGGALGFWEDDNAPAPSSRLPAGKPAPTPAGGSKTLLPDVDMPSGKKHGGKVKHRDDGGGVMPDNEWGADSAPPPAPPSSGAPPSGTPSGPSQSLLPPLQMRGPAPKAKRARKRS